VFLGYFPVGVIGVTYGGEGFLGGGARGEVFTGEGPISSS
jgi:hypothetical protein